MDRWQVDDLLLLADVIAAAGLHTFVVRRALQRLEWGEITPLKAAQLIAGSNDQGLCVARDARAGL